LPQIDDSQKSSDISTWQVVFADFNEALAVLGPRDAHLRVIERIFNASLFLRGTTLEISAQVESTSKIRRLIENFIMAVRSGGQVTSADIEYASNLSLQTATDSNLFSDVILTTYRGKQITPKSKVQQKYLNAIREHDLVFGIGPAGTGKTYLAVAMAVAMLNAKRVQRIILTRPAVEAGERLGFLPGDLHEKINPYLRPLYDALYDMLDIDRVERLLDKKVIEVAPLAFMRGRTINDAFIIVDEAQNTTPEQMKMLLTRLGFGSRAVVTGDITQIDLPVGQRSGLIEVKKIIENVDGISFITFDEKDVVRHPLVRKIVQAYDLHQNGKKTTTE
jgi:phosphate starvation-inducible PhoH-like protein